MSQRYFGINLLQPSSLKNFVLVANCWDLIWRLHTSLPNNVDYMCGNVLLTEPALNKMPAKQTSYSCVMLSEHLIGYSKIRYLRNNSPLSIELTDDPYVNLTSAISHTQAFVNMLRDSKCLTEDNIRATRLWSCVAPAEIDF